MKLKEVGYVKYENGEGIWFDLNNVAFYDKNFNRHRTDGPAVIYQDNYSVWYVNDKYIKDYWNET